MARLALIFVVVIVCSFSPRTVDALDYTPTAANAPFFRFIWSNSVFGEDRSQTFNYTLAKSTPRIVLYYQIQSTSHHEALSDERPLADMWSLTLTGPGGVLFSLGRQELDQTVKEPMWIPIPAPMYIPSHSTEVFTVPIDVSQLTLNGPVELQLTGSVLRNYPFPARNCCQTFLQADIFGGVPNYLFIDAADAEALNCHPRGCNDGTYYSVPAQGDVNSNLGQRYFIVSISKGVDITLETVMVTVVGGAGDLMDVVRNLPIPSNDDVQVLEQSDHAVKLKVRVTVEDPASLINGEPPPTSHFTYKFKVDARNSTNKTYSAERSVHGLHALWRTVNVLPSRFSQPADPGFDDWALRGTYNWIIQNAALLPAVNDVSLEHGRGIHHFRGTELDLYHFYRFRPGLSGQQNYDALRTNLISAFDTIRPDGSPNPLAPPAAIAARNEIVTFVGATRAGIDALGALDTVNAIIYMIGSPVAGLPLGWARSLITTGIVSRAPPPPVPGAPPPAAQILDLNLGLWSNTKIPTNSNNHWNPPHNSHLHVTLNRGAIGE